MKISIQNFKSIEKLIDYDIQPMTILSGLNSSGKSSFIQLLLLIKQTLQANSLNQQINLDGEFFKIKKYEDIITNRNFSNELQVKFKFSKSDDLKINSPNRINIFDLYQDFDIIVQLVYGFDSFPYIKSMFVCYILPEGDNKEQYVQFDTQKKEQHTYQSIKANSLLFGKGIWAEEPIKVSNIIYSSIFPLYYEIHRIDNEPSTKEEDEEMYLTVKEKSFLNLDGIKELLDTTFKTMSYIGPLREEPKDEYVVEEKHSSVGTTGKYVSQVLENFGKKEITFLKPHYDEDGLIKYESVSIQLLDAVNFWMCDIFKIGKRIYSERVNDIYSIYLITEQGIKTSIKHVGFGVSQILPIVVEGLLINENDTLLLEQPEIHLHPKIQSLLFDFLYSLVIQRKKIIIETHSDHFITRMRRRVAEDFENLMASNINLSFVESNDGEIIFRTIKVDNLGTIDYFPKNFIDQYSHEMKAIIKAQLKKSKHKSSGL